jgi:hypothetical protein
MRRVILNRMAAKADDPQAAIDWLIAGELLATAPSANPDTAHFYAPVNVRFRE